MTSRSVLPPSRLRRSSPEATVHLLQKKLDVAEKETVNLVQKLAGLGFKGTVKTGAGEQSNNPMGLKSPEPVQPFIPRSAETEVLHKNYQTLVARLCRNESQIQSLRLNLCSIQTAKDVAKSEAGAMKEQVTVSQEIQSAENKKTAKDVAKSEAGAMKEQVAVLQETHSTEVDRLKKDLEKTKKECQDATDARRNTENEIKKLQARLNDAAYTKPDFSIGLEDIQIAKQKLAKRVNELREELGREVSLRTSLEDSHAALLERVCEMEQMLESERREVEALNASCIKLRQEGARLLEEMKRECAQRKSMEENFNAQSTQLASKDGKIAELLEQNKVFATALAESRKTCSDLHIEVEKQAKLVIDTQTLLVQVQSERENLQEKVMKSPQNVTNDDGKLEEKNQGKNVEEQLISAKMTLSDQETKYQNELASLEHAMGVLKDELDEALREKEAALKSKDTLMDEVNSAVDSMTEERRSIQEKMIKAQAEIANLTRQKEAIEQDNTQLRERVAILEQHQSTHQKVESTISELLDSKNRLAYEKGQLQNRVEQLQRDLGKMENVRTEANKLTGVNSDLETKLRETKRDLNEAKQNLQHTENLLKQERSNASKKEEDFSLAIRARNTAVQELDELRGEYESNKVRDKQKTATLQKNLNDARSDHTKMAATLESIMTSHGQLQVVVETFQTEMGQRDHELSALRQERQSHKRLMEKMQREVTRLQEQLAAMEMADSSQLASLNADLIKTTQSQTKMASSLQEALATIAKQQIAVDGLQTERDKKAAQYQILSDTRQHEKEEFHRIREELTGKVDSLKTELRSTRDNNHKKLTLELTELRQSYTDSRTRADDLAKENKELLTKLDSVEQKLSKLKIRLGSQKTQLDQFRNTQQANKDLEAKLVQIQDRLKEMEQTKSQYAAKNRDQSRTIASFMEQMSGLQRELESLSDIQKRESDQSRDKVRKLEKDAEKGSRIHKENAKLKKQLKEMEEKKLAAEEKLAEASNESLQISNHLQEAHNWFQSRYSSLQKALSEAKKNQARLEETASEQQRELSHERQKSETQTKKAEEMLRASREALNQLANQAEIDRLETRTQMHNLAMRVQVERDHATYTDNKMQKLLNTSAELVEELALELDQSYSHIRP